MSTECTFRGECRLFDTRLARLPGLSSMFQERYCGSDYERCVRYALALEHGGECVPDALMPNNREWAEELGSVVGH